MASNSWFSSVFISFSVATSRNELLKSCNSPFFFQCTDYQRFMEDTLYFLTAVISGFEPEQHVCRPKVRFMKCILGKNNLRNLIVGKRIIIRQPVKNPSAASVRSIRAGQKLQEFLGHTYHEDQSRLFRHDLRCNR